MASNYAAILADIKTKMESVTDIGKVHDYLRWNVDPSKFINLFVWTSAAGQKQIRGWELTRVSAAEHKRGAYFKHHIFAISGYMGLNDSDATDKTFQALVDDVCEKFRAAAGGASWDYRNGDEPNNSPAQVNVIEPRMFGNTLCHYAEIRLSVTERIVA